MNNLTILKKYNNNKKLTTYLVRDFRKLKHLFLTQLHCNCIQIN